MPRALYLLANLLGGVVLVLLLLDPTRPLGPVFVLLGLLQSVPWSRGSCLADGRGLEGESREGKEGTRATAEPTRLAERGRFGGRYGDDIRPPAALATS